MKRRGFTLIELLAVIVILAMIALIATPVILNVINRANIGSTENSVYGYVDAVEKSYVVAVTNGTISNWPEKDSEGCYTVADIKDFIKSKGSKPTDDTTVCFDAKNTVSTMTGTINNYGFTYEDNKVIIGDENTEIVEVLTGGPIDSVAQTLLDSSTATYTYMGGTYLKGTQKNNFVWYNGFMWRIMGKNSDGTVRLITDEAVVALPWGASNVGDWNAEGYIKNWIDDYFLSNLKSNLSRIIKKGDYFCSELTTDAKPVRITCSTNSIVNSKIGLISVDEYNLAGAKTSYLNIEHPQWTMTPYSAAKTWYVVYGGGIGNTAVSLVQGVRPVINVKPESIITGGNGTATDMYILNENKTTATGTIGSNATSGEYVLLEGKTYRVVSKDSDGIKLILDGYYDANKDGTIDTTNDGVAFGTDNKFTSASGMGLTLNTTVLEWLGLTNSDKLVSTTWYQGKGLEYSQGFKYEDTLNEINSISDVKVGLIRLGEMLASQSSTMLTKNYTATYSDQNAKWYFTMSNNSSSDAVFVITQVVSTWGVNVSDSTSAVVRPVIKVRKNLPINGGNGTWNNPYQI